MTSSLGTKPLAPRRSSSCVHEPNLLSPVQLFPTLLHQKSCASVGYSSSVARKGRSNISAELSRDNCPAEQSAESLQPILCDDGLIDPGTCHQHQPQLQQPRLHKIKRPPRLIARACDLFDDVLILMRPAARRSLYIDVVIICLGTSTSYGVTEWEVISTIRVICRKCMTLYLYSG